MSTIHASIKVLHHCDSGVFCLLFSDGAVLVSINLQKDLCQILKTVLFKCLQTIRFVDFIDGHSIVVEVARIKCCLNKIDIADCYKRVC